MTVYAAPETIIMTPAIPSAGVIWGCIGNGGSDPPEVPAASQCLITPCSSTTVCVPLVAVGCGRAVSVALDGNTANDETTLLDADMGAVAEVVSDATVVESVGCGGVIEVDGGAEESCDVGGGAAEEGGGCEEAGEAEGASCLICSPLSSVGAAPAKRD